MERKTIESSMNNMSMTYIKCYGQMSILEMCIVYLAEGAFYSFLHFSLYFSPFKLYGVSDQNLSLFAIDFNDGYSNRIHHESYLDLYCH